MKYFISDLHFFHGNILNMDKRNFSNITEMQEHIIAKWNSKVKEDDEVYILGDLSWEKGINTYNLLTKLHGKLILVEGNHDAWYLDDPNFDDYIFEDVRNYMEINMKDKFLVLSHYPMFFYNHQFHKNDSKYMTYMLYGHVHNTYDEYMINSFINKASTLERLTAGDEREYTPFQMINCFCAFSDYTPLTIDEWIAIDKERREMINQYEKEQGGSLSYEQWMELNDIIISKFTNL
ncbi:MAG: metallophosphoesterase family protein [Erysipelotrichaceae bacterium]|nr:metallophosphoesterase family protein [Erysipelotrichaceae bacterium]